MIALRAIIRTGSRGTRLKSRLEPRDGSLRIVDDGSAGFDRPHHTSQPRPRRPFTIVVVYITAYIKMTPGQLGLDLRPRTWGGAREGAGRKKVKGRSDPVHLRRPEHEAYHPSHVVLRTRRDVARLRRGEVLRAIRRALRRIARRGDFRVVHMSIQHNHLHLIVEADHKVALSRGMQGFAIAAARSINGVLGRRGKVFAFRYHATEITNPRQARHALAYVLNNWRRHGEDERGQRERAAAVDPYSSGIAFDGWKERSSFPIPDGYVPLPVVRPQTWLMQKGWQLGGPKIGLRERPGRFGWR